MSQELSPRQSAIVSLLFDAVGVQDPVTPLSFALSGDFKEKFSAVVARAEAADEPAIIVCSLPRYGSTAFVALTKSREVEVARLLANLEDLERENGSPLALGETVGFNQMHHTSGSPPIAVLLLPTAVSELLRALPNEFQPNGEVTRFAFVLPLTENELACKNERGQDALVDMFQQRGKSLFFDAIAQ